MYMLAVAYFSSVVGFIVLSKYMFNQLEKLKDDVQGQELTLDIATIKDEILEIVEDTLANLQQPTALDHIGGAIGQFIQYKLMKSVQLDNLLGNDLITPSMEGSRDPLSSEHTNPGNHGKTKEWTKINYSKKKTRNFIN